MLLGIHLTFNDLQCSHALDLLGTAADTADVDENCDETSMCEIKKSLCFSTENQFDDDELCNIS